jgi:hypothetical protein
MLKMVSNTTPIIALSSIGRLELLGKYYEEIIIPEAVMSEIVSGGKIIIPNLREFSWLKEIPDRKGIETKLLFGLDEGEKQVILIALKEKIERVLIDERKARKIAGMLNLKVVGTLGILARAKRENLIQVFRSEAYKLIENGLYYSLELIEEMAKELEESN